MTIFNLPDLGEGLTEATLLSWLVAEGETVHVDQPIAEVETAKSSIEVPSPYAGTVHTLHGSTGDTLEVGNPLITVTTEDDADSPADSSTDGRAGALSYREEERAGTAAPESQDTDEETEGSGNVLIGYGTSQASSARRRRKRSGAPRADTQRPTDAAAQGSAAQRSTTSPGPAQAPRVSSPLVRRMARRQGVELHSISGSGPEGLIMRRDVLAAGEQPAAAGAGAPQREPARDAAQQDAAAAAGAVDSRTGLAVRERVAVTGMRKAIAAKMSQSRREIPEATVWQDVDVTALLDMRAQLKDSGQEAPSVLALLSRFVVAGLQRYPELAARIEHTDAGDQIVHFAGINLGFAAQTETGLVVPVVREAQRLSARGLNTEIRRLAESARDGQISSKEMSGGTFTVNNYGVFGSDGATPIINHPEAAILGIGRIIDRPWAVGGELAVRKVTTLTLAFDHRVCDGGAAGGFLNFVATCMGDPTAALADL
ncbi:dihydrolipoamide acetyltransferase family protein [Garicola koreensis]|uniref:Dihydrolipoamide acetyltransferase component of pyruvate dehydrogenase complex n=1 Tax=Garicola koreensis TaxID=1262554 RepID=A0A7W5TU83_9MICC|nr:dihydrolipoamide acetyltransferase family protein [Garicola koreensis]MBB3667863.1 pyruvate dehydrogenase E2 component (dihydrolipoamide acetyltransferase) [Garicola koreensis]